MSGVVRGRPGTRLFEAAYFWANEPAVPPEDGVRGDDARDVAETTPTEGLSLHRQAAPLVVSEPGPAATALRAQDAVLLEQVVDGRLLLAVDPAREQKQEEASGEGTASMSPQLPQEAPTLQGWPGTGMVTVAGAVSCPAVELRPPQWQPQPRPSFRTGRDPGRE